jgi:hypothetical protein
LLRAFAQCGRDKARLPSNDVHFQAGIKNLPQHLRAADIIVLRWRGEGFSNGIIEAAASSFPDATDVAETLRP